MIKYLIKFAKFFLPDYFATAKKTKSTQVITIGLSHYCEYATWALTIGKVPFMEHSFAPGQHVFASLAARIGQGKQKYLSSSSRMTSVKDAALLNEQKDSLSPELLAKLKRKESSSRSTAVPFAALPDGSVRLDSWEIASITTLTPIAANLKQLLDEEIGPLARQRAYSMLLKKEHVHLFHALCTDGRSWLWRWVWWFGFGKMVLETLQKSLDTNNPQAYIVCKEKLTKAMSQLDDIITKRTTKFINGDTIGLADLAIASLAAPIVLPPLYCGGIFHRYFQDMIDRDEEARQEVEMWRQTITGKFVLRIYSEFRLTKASK